MSGRVRTRSFDNATGSVTANDTPDLTHASRVNASTSKSGGSPGACETRRDEVRTCLVTVSCVVSVIVSIPGRYETQPQHLVFNERNPHPIQRQHHSLHSPAPTKQTRSGTMRAAGIS